MSWTSWVLNMLKVKRHATLWKQCDECVIFIWKIQKTWYLSCSHGNYIFFAAPTTSLTWMVEIMSKLLHVSRKTLDKYTKFRVWIDENNEATCWVLICRKPYRDRISGGVGEKVVYFWDNHSLVILDRKHVLWQLFSRGIYVEHCNHIMDMKGVALFE